MDFIYKINVSYVYILASKPNGTLYIGVTSDLLARVYEHKLSNIPSFTSRYRVHMLVYYEAYDDIYDDIYAAIQREKNLKHWLRQWKIKLIEKMNPDWKDLYPDLIG